MLISFIMVGVLVVEAGLARGPPTRPTAHARARAHPPVLIFVYGGKVLLILRDNGK